MVVKTLIGGFNTHLPGDREFEHLFTSLLVVHFLCQISVAHFSLRVVFPLLFVGALYICFACESFVA